MSEFKGNENVSPAYILAGLLAAAAVVIML
jgi:hypothetical protein